MNSHTAVDRMRRVRMLFTRPKTFVVWYGDRFAVFLSNDTPGEIKRLFVEVGGASQNDRHLVRCREIPVLGHRPTWTDEMVSNGLIFASWKYNTVSGKVWGWDTKDRENAQQWLLTGGSPR